MIYKRKVESNGWKYGDLAIVKGKSNKKFIHILTGRLSFATRHFEKTDLTYEEAKLIMLL